MGSRSPKENEQFWGIVLSSEQHFESLLQQQRTQQKVQQRHQRDRCSRLHCS